MKMKDKKLVDVRLMELGEGAFWKEFEDKNPQLEQRYIIVNNDQIIVLNGKLRQKVKKILV